ncbi:MAG: hypothetical protein OEU92_24345 [Alphaproteobacteria bacterium]|nr:hypothetical protein [Alphaproteobacteria bacterium]
MNDNNASFQGHPSLDDRQAAEQKLCRLFKSFGVDALAARDRLIDPYLERAATFWRPQSGLDFAALALQDVEADLEAWFAALLGERLEDRAAAVMTGRAAFLMCGGPSRFADQLLQPVASLPAAFVEALSAQAPCAVPEDELGEMHHQPYEAWSPTALMVRALPLERGLLQHLAGLVRREGRAVTIGLRNTGPTS